MRSFTEKVFQRKIEKKVQSTMNNGRDGIVRSNQLATHMLSGQGYKQATDTTRLHPSQHKPVHLPTPAIQMKTL